MIQLRANPGSTGRLLKEMLTAKGLLTGEVKGAVNYGYGGPTTLPCLNRKAGTFNKLQELEMLQAKGVATVPFSRSPMDLAAPVLGRMLHHTRGMDIRLYKVRTVMPEHEYFTQLVPKQREFRVWAFRRKMIGVYEKILTYPNKLGRRGRLKEVWNWGNGYAYSFVHPEQVPANLKSISTAAVDALGLDFGAVDVILGADGKYYVLENNCAPGVEGPRQCLQSLVNHIDKWARSGFKKRNGEK